MQGRDAGEDGGVGMQHLVGRSYKINPSVAGYEFTATSCHLASPIGKEGEKNAAAGLELTRLGNQGRGMYVITMPSDLGAHPSQKSEAVKH